MPPTSITAHKKVNKKTIINKIQNKILISINLTFLLLVWEIPYSSILFSCQCALHPDSGSVSNWDTDTDSAS